METKFTREAVFGAPAADDERIPVIISTEHPVDRGEFVEVLSHESPAHVDLTRAPLPLLASHNIRTLPLGVVEDLRLDTGQRVLRGFARFAPTAEGQSLRNAVLSKVIRSISIGYDLMGELRRYGDTIRFAFRPYEASAVAVPADPGAGFFRSYEVPMHLHSESLASDALSRIARDASSLRQYVGDDTNRASGLAADLSQKEISRYSIGRAVARAWSGNPEQTLESEITRAHFARREGRLNGGDRIIIPAQVLSRAMASVPGSKGGFAIGAEVHSVADALRPQSVVLAAGATVLPRLSTTTLIPRQSGNTTATWQSGDGSTVAASDPALGQVELVPRTLIGRTLISEQLLRQSPQVLDFFLLRELSRVLASALDAAAIAGTGGAQPLGILSTPGVGTQSGTALAWGGICNMRETIATGNANDAAATWISAPVLRELLAQRERIVTSGRFFWENDSIDARPALVTTNCPAATLIHGDFTKLVIGEFFDGLEIAVNPSEGFNTGQITVRGLLMCDVAVLHAGAFIVSTSIT